MNGVGVRFAGPSVPSVDADAVDTLVSCQFSRYSLSLVAGRSGSGWKPRGATGVTVSSGTVWRTGCRRASTRLRREFSSVRSSHRRLFRAACRSFSVMVYAAVRPTPPGPRPLMKHPDLGQGLRVVADGDLLPDVGGQRQVQISQPMTADPIPVHLPRRRDGQQQQIP